MYRNKFPFFLIIIVSVARAATAYGENIQYAQAQLPGPCPKIRYITNVDIPAIVGWFYRPYSNFDNQLCFNNEGQSMFAAQYNDTMTNIIMCCRAAVDLSVSHCGADVGSGTAMIVQNPGEFIYQYLNNVYSVYVLDTDYVNFTLIYGCKPNGQFRDELIYVFSRGYTLNATLTARARQVFESNGVAWSNARQVKQGTSIPYPQLPKQCN